MKTISIFTFVFGFGLFTQAGESLLTHEAQVTGFGTIKYRPPVVQGARLPIVLFHGIYGGVSHRTWRQLVPELDQAGERVFLMDLPGAGESDTPRRTYSIEDFDLFVERFLEEVVGQRAAVVSESILSNGVLKVASTRPDLIRRVVMISPSGVKTLNEPPTVGEQRLFDNFWAEAGDPALFGKDQGLIAFYETLLEENSLRFFLAFGFFDDTLVNDDLLSDFSVLQSNIGQRFLSLSFVAGQLYRTFEESSQNVFVPVLGLFGKEYEPFQDNPVSTAADFADIRPAFQYVEIEEAGGSVQREQPKRVAEEIIIFSEPS